MDPTQESPAEPQELRCAECHGRLAPDQDRETTEDGVFCRHCFDNLTAQLQQVMEAQGRDIHYPTAALGGLLGGVAGVLAWWGFTVLTNVAFGLVAVVIGYAVGKGVVMFSAGKRSMNLQLLSVGISLVAFAYASYLVNRTFIQRAYAEEGLALPLLPDPLLFVNVVMAGFGVMDVVFLAIALYQAWQLPRPFELAG
jgi:energy-converting hydrogenase Eha subunit E